MPTLTYFGHSAFIVRERTHVVAIDPFFTGNPHAPIEAQDVHCTHIAITHGHADHLGDAPSIAKRCGATIHAAYEICEFIGTEHGHNRFEPGNPGGRVDTPFGFIAFTQAFHSSSYNGRYMGQPCGVIVNIGGRTIYHAGDTAIFGDMRLIGELYRPDVAILPAGDRFTMGPAHAARAAELVAAPIAVPCHFGTWPLLTSDLSAFTPKGVQARVLRPGQSFEF